MIYSVAGHSGGKLAHLLNMSVIHPNRNFGRRGAWEIDVERKDGNDDKMPPINYGCKREQINKNCINYNSEDTTDKLGTFKILDHLHIDYPKIINPEGYSESFLGRSNFGSKGKGIVRYLKGSEAWKNKKHDYFCEFIDGKEEYRVHVFGEFPILELKKDFSKNVGSPFIRNYNNGSKLVPDYIHHPKRLQILDACVAIIKYCGLTYGAIDLIIEKETDRWLVLECNSAPNLAGIYGYIYAQEINRYFNLGINFNWKITNGEVQKVPKSFFFEKKS